MFDHRYLISQPVQSVFAAQLGKFDDTKGSCRKTWAGTALLFGYGELLMQAPCPLSLLYTSHTGHCNCGLIDSRQGMCRP